MALDFVPLGEALGVEVRGFDPSQPVTDTDSEALHAA